VTISRWRPEAAGVGDTIVVSKGTYTGPVVIDGKTDLTIKGNAVLDGQGAGVVLTIQNSTDVTITKLTVQGRGATGS